MPQLTNATKAQIVVAINAVLAAVASFGSYLTDNQRGTVALAVNAVLGVWVAATYQSSPKRVPDAPPAASVPAPPV